MPNTAARVQRAGAAGEGFLELPVDAQPFQRGGQSGQFPDHRLCEVLPS